MTLYIGYQSALEFWRKRLLLPKNGSTNSRGRKILLPTNPIAISLPDNLGLTLPVHVILGDARARRTLPAMKQHVLTAALPASSFLDAGGGLQVSSPEFCFLQMASQLPLVQLIELGFELCGRYSMPASSFQVMPSSGFNQRPPLTSIMKLNAFIAQTPGLDGHQKATRALRHILDDSASPRETKLTLLLCLPPKLGGRGFARPLLNVRIDLPQPVRIDTGKAYFECDLFWPEHKLAVEYDSDLHHTGPERIAADSKRRNYLGSVGIKTVTVTNEQITDSVSFEAVVRLLASHLERRTNQNNPGNTAARRELRRLLLKPGAVSAGERLASGSPGPAAR